MTAIRVARRNRYTSIDRQTINDGNLSFRARGILIWLLDKPDDWRVDSEQIATEAKEGRDAVRTALNELVAVGYIVRVKEQDDHGRWSTTTWVRERPTDDGKPVVGNPATDDWGTDDWKTDAGESGALTKTVTEDCDKEEPSVPPPPTPRKRAEVDEEFEAWWKLYPKKAAGKGQARERWRKLLVAERRDALAAIERHVAWWTERETDVQFIPAGNVWLNQRRWEDEQPRSAIRVNAPPPPTSMMDRVKAKLAAERAAKLAQEQDQDTTQKTEAR